MSPTDFFFVATVLLLVVAAAAAAGNSFGFLGSFELLFNNGRPSNAVDR